MTTRQPNWKLIANLGDASFADYGGLLVYEDTTGVYEPEGEYYYAPEDESGTGEVYRFILERCKLHDGHLITAKWDETWVYAAKQYHEWLDDRTEDVSRSCGFENQELRHMFCSDNAVARAMAYQALGQHFGFIELDNYPLTLTDAEGHERYADIPRKAEA